MKEKFNKLKTSPSYSGLVLMVAALLMTTAMVPALALDRWEDVGGLHRVAGHLAGGGKLALHKAHHLAVF